MTTREPTVSAIVAVFNGEALIAQCIAAIIAQTYDELEIIIVDDGSTDQTAVIVREFGDRVKLIQQPNSKVAVARQNGLSEATGDFIAFCDHDDCWSPHKIERQVAAMTRQPELALSYTDALQLNTQNEEMTLFGDRHPSIREYARDKLLAGIIRRHAVPLLSTFMVRRRFLESRMIRLADYPGGVDDVALIIDLLLAGGMVAYLDEPLTTRHMHGQNWSGDYLRRFQLRIPMYERLLTKYKENLSVTDMKLLRYGLSDATFRVANEIRRDASQMDLAREYFKVSWVNNRRNWKALMKWLM